MAFVPGSRKQQTWPSTVAYMAQLIIHRYAMLGVLDEAGFPLQQMGILEAPGHHQQQGDAEGASCATSAATHHDPQGWLRLLHRLRRCWHVWLS
jgi:hypothetical protein